MPALAAAGFHGIAPLLDGAGHWVQQEQAARVSERLLGFLKGHATSRAERRAAAVLRLLPSALQVGGVIDDKALAAEAYAKIREVEPSCHAVW